MNKTTITIALSLLPAALVAQQANVSSHTSAHAEGRAPQASFSADAQAKLDASFSRARANRLPERPMHDRIQEGRAKGATEAQIVAAVERTETRMEATQRAMVKAGRTEPSAEEIERGEEVMARGATEAQIEAFVRRSPSDRSLVVAFDVLSTLTARGVAVDHALAQVSSRLQAGGNSDEALRALTVNAGASATTGTAVQAGPPSVTGSVNGAATGAVKIIKP
jgi:hypothetical protein